MVAKEVRLVRLSTLNINGALNLVLPARTVESIKLKRKSPADKLKC